MKRNSKVLAIVLGALVMFGGAGATQAASPDRDDACYRKVHEEERELNRAIDRYGFRSRQANHERRDLEKARDRCRVQRDRDDRYRHDRDDRYDRYRYH
jgi:hypothetical protein